MTQLVTFFLGLAFGLALASILWMAWAEDYESQVRYWRRQALKLKGADND